MLAKESLVFVLVLMMIVGELLLEKGLLSGFTTGCLPAGSCFVSGINEEEVVVVIGISFVESSSSLSY